MQSGLLVNNGPVANHGLIFKTFCAGFIYKCLSATPMALPPSLEKSDLFVTRDEADSVTWAPTLSHGLGH